MAMSDDDLIYNETVDPLEPWTADEFGERIISDRVANGVPGDDDAAISGPTVASMMDDDDLLVEEGLVHTTTVSDSMAPIDPNDADFHETLRDANVSDQLADDDLVLEDGDLAVDDAKSHHESLLDRAKHKIEDIKDNF